ncbi:hypothetical protein WJX74_007578 [Apatococcus lobatus]|uniref:Deltamethrin resistance protein prag01 domain-containing protein n=1 Tax=Apatococcus lobatus TaxID=904363 RepID=A0AAW1QXN1_9CHLO
MSFAARGLNGRLAGQAAAQVRGFAKAPPGPLVPETVPTASAFEKPFKPQEWKFSHQYALLGVVACLVGYGFYTVMAGPNPTSPEARKQ